MLNSRDGARACAEGFWVRRGGLRAALQPLLRSSSNIIVCTEGAPRLSEVLADISKASSFIIVLGDDAGLSAASHVEIDEAAREHSARVFAASLGPTELLASAAITLVHAVLDDALGASGTRKEWRRQGSFPACEACNQCNQPII